MQGSDVSPASFCTIRFEYGINTSTGLKRYSFMNLSMISFVFEGWSVSPT